MRKQMINRSAVSAFVLISTLMLGFSPFAKADCPANAIKGTWIANGSYWTPVSDVAADIGWFTCKLQINSSGKIRTTKESSCKDENGTKTVVTSGKFSVSKSCRVSGVIRFGGGTNIELSGGQMSASAGDHISANGLLANGPREYSMVITKRPE